MHTFTILQDVAGKFSVLVSADGVDEVLPSEIFLQTNVDSDTGQTKYTFMVRAEHGEREDVLNWRERLRWIPNSEWRLLYNIPQVP